MNKLIYILLCVFIAIGGMFAGSKLFPETDIVTVSKIIEVPVIINQSIPFEVIKEVEVEKEILVDIIKEVDNQHLAEVVEFVSEYFNNEDYEEFFEDEDEIVDKILMINKFIYDSESELMINYKQILDNEDAFEDDLEDYRKSEISLKKLYDVELDDFDFDDKEATLVFPLTIRAKESGEDSEYFNYMFEVEIYNGNIIEVNLVD